MTSQPTEKLIERLRNYSRYDEPEGESVYTEARLRRAAVDEIERLRSALEAMTRELNRYRDCFGEITAKATPYGSGPEDDRDRVTSYIIPSGPLHRAAGKIEGQMFDGEQHLKNAVARILELEADLHSVRQQALEEAIREFQSIDGSDAPTPEAAATLEGIKIAVIKRLRALSPSKEK